MDNMHENERQVADNATDVEKGRQPDRTESQPSSTTSSGHADPPEKSTAPTEGKDPNLVTYDENDPLDPHSWSKRKRWYITILTSLLVLTATFASSAPSNILMEQDAELGLSEEVGTLSISLFLLGYCTGPTVFSPLSEEYGRYPVFVLAFGVFSLFNLGPALAQNGATLLVTRFLGGTFASAPLANSGAVLTDIWDPITRGYSFSLFTLAPFAGPVLGPLVSGWISTSGTNWRILYWVLFAFAGACFFLLVFTLPETYTPIILVRKAKALRKSTGNSELYAQFERKDHKLVHVFKTALSRPFIMLVMEPILFLTTLYMSFIYAVIYALFEAYPVVFGEEKGFSNGAIGLMFIPIGLGAAAASVIALIPQRRYGRLLRANGMKPIRPEERLIVTFACGPLLVVGFFWFGWTSYPEISFWSPMVAGSLIGMAATFMFLGFLNYIAETYLQFAASALAANTVVRSAFGAGFPLFARQMFVNLTPRWASTLLALISLVLSPIPVVFYIYGERRFAPT